MKLFELIFGRFFKLKFDINFATPAFFSSGVLISERIIRMIFGLFVGAWVARHLGPNDYGVLAYALTYVAIVQSFASMGLDALLVRDLSISRNHSGALIYTAGVLKIIAAFFFVGLSTGFQLFIGNMEDIELHLVVLASIAVLFQSADVFDMYFQSRSSVFKSVGARLIAYVFCNGLKVLAILFDCDVIYFAVISSFEFALVAIFLFFFYKREHVKHHRFDFDVAKKYLIQGFPMMISAVSIVVYMRVDQFMIRDILGDAELGRYSAMLPINGMWSIVPAAICTSFAPAIAIAKKTNDVDYQNALLRLFRLCGFSAIVVSVCIYFTADYVIGILYGDQYLKSAEVLKIYSLSNFAVFSGMAQTLWIVNEGKTSLAMYKALLGGVVSYSVNAYTLPRYGLIGVAYSAIASQFSSAIISNIFIAPRLILMQLGICISPKKH